MKSILPMLGIQVRPGYLEKVISAGFVGVMKIGKEIGESDPPKPGEREGVYWHRVGGRFLDTYIEACREAFKAARQ